MTAVRRALLAELGFAVLGAVGWTVVRNTHVLAFDVGIWTALCNALLVLVRAARSMERPVHQAVLSFRIGWGMRLVLLVVVLFFLRRVVAGVDFLVFLAGYLVAQGVTWWTMRLGEGL